MNDQAISFETFAEYHPGCLDIDKHTAFDMREFPSIERSAELESGCSAQQTQPSWGGNPPTPTIKTDDSISTTMDVPASHAAICYFDYNILDPHCVINQGRKPGRVPVLLVLRELIGAAR